MWSPGSGRTQLAVLPLAESVTVEIRRRSRRVVGEVDHVAAECNWVCFELGKPWKTAAVAAS